MYELKDVPGKGKGLVATINVRQGTRILCEEAAIRIPHNLDQLGSKKQQRYVCRQFNALTEQQRLAFLFLRNIYPYKTPAEQYIGIIRTNAFQIEDGETGGAVFLEASRINHACNNNAQKSWNENIKRHTVHALRDIKKVKKSQNDEILEEINHLDCLVGQHGLEGILSSPLRTLRYLDREIQLYDMTGPDDPGLSRVYLDAAQVAIVHGDLARGRIFAERAVRSWRISGGSDDKNVIEYGALPQNPSQLPLYGMSMQWKTTVDDALNALGSTEFEDWLWKREKSPRSGAQIGFHNRAIFPAFSGLPGDRGVDMEFYRGSDQPHQHWCFLAEIVDFDFLTRLHMEISDVDGRKLPLFFYTDGRGSELDLTKIQRGYTIAILCAQQHAFMFDKPGIRHEDPARVKTCQARGWNKNFHKTSCKLFQDPDLRGMLLLDWSQFDKYLSFPLSVSKDVIQPSGKPYTIRSIAGKGKGLVAAERISKGTCLLSENPFFRVPRGDLNIEALDIIVENEVKHLTSDQRAAFSNLTNIYGDAPSHSLGIARTKFLPLVGSNDVSGGLFLDAARINHSCRHNAQNTWKENIGELTIHALQDIEAGQEIAIPCLVIQRNFSDERLKKLHFIDSSIRSFFWGDLDAKIALNLLYMMFGLFDEEGV
ncbi:SET domain-containing protein [Penicillium canescens]|nr:SET domain-containing protein [Penicillium canescens]